MQADNKPCLAYRPTHDKTAETPDSMHNIMHAIIAGHVTKGVAWKPALNELGGCIETMVSINAARA